MKELKRISSEILQLSYKIKWLFFLNIEFLPY